MSKKKENLIPVISSFIVFDIVSYLPFYINSVFKGNMKGDYLTLMVIKNINCQTHSFRSFLFRYFKKRTMLSYVKTLSYNSLFILYFSNIELFSIISPLTDQLSPMSYKFLKLTQRFTEIKGDMLESSKKTFIN